LIGSGGSGGLSNRDQWKYSFLPAVKNAGLAPLGYYGGLTMTHALLAGSLAIDAGDNSVAVAYALDNDERGEATTESWTVITTQICASILEP